ncbi:MAG: alpha/beta hydrolase [Actinomycetota bacterium]|nr:alpha/beta hydrolase [Actinomycetota bacterium]
MNAGVASTVSALAAFHTAWSAARRSYGHGVPQGGAPWDASTRLRQLGAQVGAAVPGPVWAGAAAGAYESTNSRHQAVFGRLAELDQRLGRAVDDSASLVTGGRHDLDALRRWVDAAAASVPAGADREAALARIAGVGLRRLVEIVGGTHADLSAVARDILAINGEYRVLSAQGDELTAPGTADPGPEDDHEEGRTDMSSGDVEAIDQANRDLLSEMRAEYQQLPDGQVKTDRLADIAAIREALTVPGSHLIHLERPEDPSQMIPAATSVGDPFTADHVSVTVPGVSGTTRGTIASMTGEARDLRNEAIDVARAASTADRPISTDIAAVAWVGYQPPANLGQTSVLDDDLAQAGAPKLSSFLGDLESASRNPAQTTALFGHSYGSLTSGIALADGASAYVDNAVLYGSPGFQATSTADLGMRDDNFFVMSTPEDKINPIGALAPLHGWGANPNDIIYDQGDDVGRYRFPHLETGAGDTPIPGYESKTGASEHSDYGRNAGERMTGYNLAAILLDRPDLAVPETPRDDPSPR